MSNFLVQTSPGNLHDNRFTHAAEASLLSQIHSQTGYHALSPNSGFVPALPPAHHTLAVSAELMAADASATADRAILRAASTSPRRVVPPQGLRSAQDSAVVASVHASADLALARAASMSPPSVLASSPRGMNALGVQPIEMHSVMPGIEGSPIRMYY